MCNNYKVHNTPADSQPYNYKRQVGDRYVKMTAIPALAENSSTPEGTKRQESRPIGTKHILVVDDEPLLVRINQRLLENNGYTVTGTKDSREAMEKVRAEPQQKMLMQWVSRNISANQ